MPNTKDVMLSVAQVVALAPGDDDNATWINPGFSGVVRKITERKTKTGKPFFPCTIADVTGPETIEVSFFNARPAFREGDLIDIYGKGLRRTEYNGNAQAAVGKDTQVEVIGKSAHHEEQVQRADTGQPAVNGHAQHVNGQTVGMAVKEAIALVVAAEKPSNFYALNEAAFWKQVKQTASNIIRISQSLETGHLSPASWPTAATQPAPAAQPPPPQTGGRSDPPAPAAKPKAGPGGAVDIPVGDEDVPF